MTIKKVAGSNPDEKTTGFFFDVYNQWPGLFSRSGNWYDFTLIKLQGEYAPYSGRYELEFGLLGFTLICTYVYSDEFCKELDQMFVELTEEDKK